jgi:hypothetical protein
MANPTMVLPSYDLFSVEENFLTELSVEDESMITGGDGKYGDDDDHKKHRKGGENEGKRHGKGPKYDPCKCYYVCH